MLSAKVCAAREIDSEKAIKLLENPTMVSVRFFLLCEGFTH
jgi:hypothetical protein